MLNPLQSTLTSRPGSALQRAHTDSVWCVKVCRQRWVAIDQSLIDASEEADKTYAQIRYLMKTGVSRKRITYLPSSDIKIDRILSVCPTILPGRQSNNLGSQIRKNHLPFLPPRPLRPARGSHILTILSGPPLTIVLPIWSTARA